MNLESVIPIAISAASLLLSYFNRRDKVIADLRAEIEELKKDRIKLNVIEERVANMVHYLDKFNDKLDDIERGL